MPEAWRGSITLCLIVNPQLLGMPAGPAVMLDLKVPGMGWISAVSITQPAHRRMMKYLGSPEPAVGGSAAWQVSLLPVFSSLLEVRKDRGFPLRGFDMETAAWAIYIDNLTEDEIFEAESAAALLGQASTRMLAAEDRYVGWASPGSDDKAVNRQVDRTSLGVRTEGELGRRDTPAQYCCGLVSATLWLLKHDEVQHKWMEVVLGRWVRQMCLRRATFVCFDRAWVWLSTTQGSGPLPTAVRSELLAAVCLLPLMYADLRGPLSGEVSATDASERGGGVVVSTGLTVEGLRYLERCQSASDSPSGDEVVLLGPFDGVSAMRVAWHNLGLGCAGHISIDNCPHARRVVESEWPDVEHHADILKVDDKVIGNWKHKYPGAKHVVSVGGFPCQDLSGANVQRKGLSGARSGLFWELVRVWKTLTRSWKSARLHRCAENVQGLKHEDEMTISKELGVPALAACASLFAWCNRPRLFWIDWRPQQRSGEASVLSALERVDS